MATRLREKLDRGEVAVGHMVAEFWTRGITQVLEVAGFDFVLFDMEHSGASMRDLADQLAWARATSLTSIVRIPAGMNAYGRAHSMPAQTESWCRRSTLWRM